MKTTSLRYSFVYLALASLLFVTNISLAQQANKAGSNANKVDQNLKASSRINPVTLAMEFSLPLGVYPGRSGNSIPISFNYSSKLWQTNVIDNKYDNVLVNQSERIINDFQKASLTFSPNSAVGWDTTLRSPRIVKADRLFFEWGDYAGPEFYGITTSCRYVISRVRDGDTDDSICTECTRTRSDGAILAQWREGCVPLGTAYTPPNPVPSPTPRQLRVAHVVKRVQIQMPDGSTVEFRKSDKVYNCITENCLSEMNGSYLAVNGSKMRFEKDELQSDNITTRDVLYLPDGSRYLFPVPDPNNTLPLIQGEAEEYIDVDGNKMLYNALQRKWTDTLGRELINPLPTQNLLTTLPLEEGTQPFTLPGMGTQTQQYELVWKKLKRPECASSTDPNCGESVLEDPAQELYYTGSDTCDAWSDDTVGNALFNGSGSVIVNGIITTTIKRKMCATQFNETPARFNPVVLSQIILPNDKSYTFKYNRYGEITKITYPTGGYERFRYDEVLPIGYVMDNTYNKVNRGVKERWVSDGSSVIQHWEYEIEDIGTAPSIHRRIRTIAPDGSKTERYVHPSSSEGYGFESSYAGMPYEERIYDTNGTLKGRKLTKWEQTEAITTDGYFAATRDAKPVREISITFEGDKALAVMSETEYDSQTDITYFAHLNPKRVKGYHYVSLTQTEANWNIGRLKDKFTSQQLASINETDYLYNANYKSRGILTLPVETRVIDPTNSQVIAKSKISYDDGGEYEIEDCNCTTTGYSAPTGSYANLRGNVTTTKTWLNTLGAVTNENAYIVTHAKYDNFGNVRKAWDAKGNVSEVEYSSTYKYAYATKAIAPAPDTTGTTGTAEKSEVRTTYDFNTGSPLTITNPNDLSNQNDDVTTTTEYDAYLRPARTFITPSGLAGETLIEYGDTVGNLYVKTKTQVDSTNYTESTTYFDGFGRAYKASVKDHLGEIFSETLFDNMGRAYKTSNPYRTGQEKKWTETIFDSSGRVWKVKAPLEQNQTEPAVSETTYGLLTTGNFIGVWVSAKDPAGKEMRNVTDGLGRLFRADEPTLNGLGTPESPNQSTFYTYDILGKLRKVTQGEQSRFFAYDSLGRLIRAKNVEQDINTNLPSYTDPITNNSGWSQAFEYDLNGNIKKQITARNITIENFYDSINRVTKRDYSDSTPEVNYFYDGKGLGLSQPPDNSKGKLTKVTNPVSENRYTSFDLLGRVLTSEQVTDGVSYPFSYQYNPITGALVSETYPSGRVVTNSFDNFGRLSSVSSKANQTQTLRIYANGFGYELKESGLEARMRLGNGLWETVKLNSLSQPVEISLGTSASNANRLKLNYTYGVRDTNGNLDLSKNNGNVESQTITVPAIGNVQGFTTTQFYEYDELNRIKRAKEKRQTEQQPDWQQQFSYDRYGNRTVVTNNNATTESLVGPNPEINTATNRIVPKQNSSEQYLFDASGNMTRDAVGNVFTFDAENHQKTYTPVNPQEPSATYSYDGDGRRVKKQVGNETTVFVYDGGGKLVAEYTLNIQPPTTPQTVYMTADVLGSPRINTNQKGEVLARHDYLPFGDEIIGFGQRASNQGYGMPDSTRQRFTGYEKDKETGLDFAQARYYGNGLGRFTSVDPSLESINLISPQSWNRYAYVLNNPLNMIDPSGLTPNDPPGRWYWNPNDVDENGFYHPQYILNGNPIPDGYTEMQSLIYWNNEKEMWTVCDPNTNNQFHFAKIERSMAEFFLWNIQNLAPLEGYSTVSEVEDTSPAEPSEKGGGALSAIKKASVGVDIVSDLRMHHWVSHGMWFSATYGKSYKLGYYGNQYQPSSIIAGDKSKAVSRFGAWKVIGRVSFGIGTGISIIKGYKAYKSGDDIGVMKSGADVTFGTLLTFGGPPGMIIGGGYFGVDATVGWGPVLRTYGQSNENYRQANGRTLWQDSKVLQ